MFSYSICTYEETQGFECYNFSLRSHLIEIVFQIGALRSLSFNELLVLGHRLKQYRTFIKNKTKQKKL